MSTVFAGNIATVKFIILINRNTSIIFIDIKSIAGYHVIRSRCSRIIIKCTSCVKLLGSEEFVAKLEILLSQ